MATVIDKKKTVEWDTETTRRRFPWNDWTNGEIWQAVEGDDFKSPASVFKQQLKKRAEANKLTLKTSVQRDGDTVSVVFQFSEV